MSKEANTLKFTKLSDKPDIFFIWEKGHNPLCNMFSIANYTCNNCTSEISWRGYAHLIHSSSLVILMRKLITLIFIRT